MFTLTVKPTTETKGKPAKENLSAPMLALKFL